MTAAENWITVRIPKDLLIRVKKTITDNRTLGYNNPSNFIQDAIRRRLESVDRE